MKTLYSSEICLQDTLRPGNWLDFFEADLRLPGTYSLPVGIIDPELGLFLLQSYLICC